MTATTKQENVTGSSQQIVATNTQALLEQQNHSTLVVTTGGRQTPRASFIETITGRRTSNELASSLMPRKVKLNEPLTKSFVEGLEKAAKSALIESKKKRLRPDIPTADQVTRSGFKTGAKLLIKVVPTATASPVEDGDNDIIIDNFSLQGIAEPDEERYQLHETFESEVLFLFGRRPRIWTLQGIILNGKRAPESPGPEEPDEQETRESMNMDFANTLIQKWEDYLRGSKAIESRSKTYISYEDQIIEGTLLAMTMVRNAQIPGAVNSTITFVVHQRTLLGQTKVGDQEVQNLQQLVEEAQINLPKVPPSDLKEAKANKEEVARRETDARASEQKLREEADRLKTERDQIQKELDQIEKDLQTNASYAQVFNTIAARGSADGATPEEFEAAKAAYGEIRRLQQEKSQLLARRGQLQNQADRNERALTEASQAQADATQKTDVTSATTDAAK